MHLITIAHISALILLSSAHMASAQPLLEALVPAYFDPTSNPNAWNTLTSTASKIPLSAIMNPNSGPGSAQDTSYLNATNNLRIAGGHVLGYVATSYGARPIGDVMADVNKYIAWYPVDGIFLDEMTSDANSSHYSYYQSIYNQIKALNVNYRIIGNPGTNTQETYLTTPTADALVIFENTAKSYSKFIPSSWVKNYNRQGFASLVYSLNNSAQIKTFLNQAVSGNSGLVYLTNDGGSNPWDTLTSYWDTEVNCIMTINAGLSC
ncbi:MAG: spherulation-specific family 4 protein [Sulfuriferula sp.]